MKKEQPKPVLSIKFDANSAAHDEIVDTISDVFRGAIIVEKSLADGFQLQDLFALIGLEPIVMEVVNDIPVFLEQFMTLTPEDAVTATLEARTKVVNENGPLGKVSGWVFSALYNLASGYKFAGQTLEGAKTQIELWKTLASGGDTMPPALLG